jgi:hypothetical protein
MAESGRMHRKAEQEAANGDDDNMARRRPGPSDAAWDLRARPLGEPPAGPVRRCVVLTGATTGRTARPSSGSGRSKPDPGVVPPASAGECCG